MNQYLPKKVADVAEYQPTLDRYPIKLDANESFLSLSPEMRAELLDKIIKFDFCKYPDPGSERLCAAYANYLGVPAEQLVAGNGSDELISLIVSGLLEKGSRVLDFSKDFSMYRFYADISEEECQTFIKEDNFTIDFEKAAQYVKQQNINLVIFSNPCNPVGNVFPREEVLRFVHESPCLVVVDEAYMDFSDQSVADCCGQLDNLIVLRTCSKAFGLAALRLGFAVSNPEIAAALRKIKSPFNVNGLSQLIGEIVISHSEVTRQNIKTLKESAQQLFVSLKALSEKHSQLEMVYPTQTNYVYIKCPTAKIIRSRLEEDGISIRAFGDGHLRVSAGSKLQNETFLKALEAFFERGEYVYEKIRAAKGNK